jgi:hypothetical protein
MARLAGDPDRCSAAVPENDSGDDRLVMPGVYRNSVADAVRYGALPIKLDLSAVLGGIIGATSRIGVGAKERLALTV